MNTKNFPLEAHGAAVSREELVQAALDEITQNYREASLSNVGPQLRRLSGLCQRVRPGADRPYL